MEEQRHSNPSSRKLFPELPTWEKRRHMYCNSALVTEVKKHRGYICKKMASAGQGCSSSESEAPPSSPPANNFVRSKALSERLPCPTSLISIGMEIAEMKKDIKEMKTTQSSISKNIGSIMEMLQSIQGVHQPDRVSEVPDVPPIRGPASTITELDELAAHPSIREQLIMQRSVTLNDTVKRMLRRLMKRELALQFSYSGLGERRQLTKTAFKYHPAFECVMDALNLCGFHLEDMRTRVVAVQLVLRHAKEWDSSRRKSVKRLALNGPSDSVTALQMPFSSQSHSHQPSHSHPSPHSHPLDHSHPSFHGQSPQSSHLEQPLHTQVTLQAQPFSQEQSSSNIQSSPSQSSCHSISSHYSQSSQLQSSHYQPPYSQAMSDCQSHVLPVLERNSSHTQPHVHSSLLSTSAEQPANHSPAPPTSRSQSLLQEDDKPAEVVIKTSSPGELSKRLSSRAQEDDTRSSTSSRNGPNGEIINPASFLQIKHEVFDEVVTYDAFEDY